MRDVPEPAPARTACLSPMLPLSYSHTRPGEWRLARGTAAYHHLMSELPHVRSLDAATTSRVLPMGRVDLIELGGIAFDRATFQAGWRWSEHAEEAGAGRLCCQRHLGFLISGRMRFRMDDGTEVEAAAGDVYSIPPGHDAWVVGDQPCAALDLSVHERGADDSPA